LLLQSFSDFALAASLNQMQAGAFLDPESVKGSRAHFEAFLANPESWLLFPSLLMFPDPRICQISIIFLSRILSLYLQSSLPDLHLLAIPLWQTFILADEPHNPASISSLISINVRIINPDGFCELIISNFDFCCTQGKLSRGLARKEHFYRLSNRYFP
jgi:hypothetical protein